MTQANVAVVFGVGPGLGAAIAHRFAREGYAVGLMARNAEKLHAIQGEIEQQGGVAAAISADATAWTLELDLRPAVETF
jgi:short-subunit dehydrogenase